MTDVELFDVLTVKNSQETKTIPVIWSLTRELLAGGVKTITTFQDSLLVFGVEFDVDNYSDAYNRYLSDPTRSVYSHVADEQSVSVFFQALNAFVSQYDLSGGEVFKHSFDGTDWDIVDDVFPVKNGVGFLILSRPSSFPINYHASLGVIDSSGLNYVYKLSDEQGLLRRADNIILDFGPYHNDNPGQSGVKVYDTSLGLDAPSAVIDIPLFNWDFNTAYKRGDFIYGWDRHYRYVIDIKSGDLEAFDIDYDAFNFAPVIYWQAELYGERSYLLGYIPAHGNGRSDPMDTIIDTEPMVGVFWSFSDEDTNRSYRYLPAPSIRINSMLVIKEGVFFTGNDNGQMLLMRLNHDGDIQWKAYLGEGTLRGITQYQGRYFVVGDRVRPPSGEYSGTFSGLGTTIMYLAEIDLPQL